MHDASSLENSPWSSKQATQRCSHEPAQLVEVATRNSSGVQRLHALKSEHPFWGYRRLCLQRADELGMLIKKPRTYV